MKYSDDRKLTPEVQRRRRITYTRPKRRYRYSKISWQQYMKDEPDGFKTVRSSFIPYTVFENRKYWLLGSFHDYPREILMDFGGSCLSKKKYQIYSPFDCAIKELGEESKNLLTPIAIKTLENMKTFSIYVGKDYYNNEKVFFFFLPLNYDDIYPVILNFNTLPDVGEPLGPMDIYTERDILNKRYLTTNNLTDFIDFLNNQ